MKIPAEIRGQNKIRDSKILQLYVRDGATYEELALRFKVSTTRIHQIIYRNKHLVKIDRDYEKVVRVNRLKRILKNKNEQCPQKDAIDVMDKLRVETEGDKDAKQQSTQKVVIIVQEQNANQSQEGRLPARILVEQ